MCSKQVAGTANCVGTDQTALLEAAIWSWSALLTQSYGRVNQLDFYSNEIPFLEHLWFWWVGEGRGVECYPGNIPEKNIFWNWGRYHSGEPSHCLSFFVDVQEKLPLYSGHTPPPPPTPLWQKFKKTTMFLWNILFEFLWRAFLIYFLWLMSQSSYWIHSQFK